MKVKVLKLGEAAKEVKVQKGATVEHVIQASGFWLFLPAINTPLFYDKPTKTVS